MLTLNFALSKHAREELVSAFHEKYQDVIVENMGYFFFSIREEKAVKSHSLTKAGSARIMNLEYENVFFSKLLELRC